jgi:hypothetical protein
MAKNTKNKLAIAFQIPLFVFSRVMIFFSSQFPAFSVRRFCYTRKNGFLMLGHPPQRIRTPSTCIFVKKLAPKRKIPPPVEFWRWDQKIARLMIGYLDRQPPGARRHTRTAGTTCTSLHGHLGVAIHIGAIEYRRRFRMSKHC